MITRNFNLYLNAGHSVPLVINVNQYDSGEQWVFTLYNSDGTQYTPSTGAIVGIKSDGLGIINSGSVVNGKVVINETQQMTAAVGKAVFELLIDSQTHGTANFVVLVEPKPGDNASLSESDLSLLQEAIDATSPLPTGGSVGQVLTKTASGSAWSDAGTPTQAQVAEAVSDWADENITVTTGVVIDTSLSVAGAAADAKKTGDEIADLKSAFSDITTTNVIWNKASMVVSSESQYVFDEFLEVPVSEGDIYSMQYDTLTGELNTSAVGYIEAFNGSTKVEQATLRKTNKKITYQVPTGINKLIFELYPSSVGATTATYTKVLVYKGTEPLLYIKDDVLPKMEVTPQDTTFFHKSINMLNPADVVEGEYVNQANGSFSDNGTYNRTPYVPVEQAKKYLIKSAMYAGYPLTMRYAFYDVSKTYISGDMVDINDYYILTAPANSAYIAFSLGATLFPMMIAESSVDVAFESYDLTYIKPEYLSENMSDSLLNLPNVIYATSGIELNIYFENLTEDWNQYSWNVICSKGMQLERGFRVTPTNADAGTYSMTIEMIPKGDWGTKKSKTVSLIITADTAGSGQNKSVIVLGDSTTDNGTVIVKLNENFANDAMSISTIGTRGTAPNNMEGRSGWNLNDYFTKASETYTDGRGTIYNPFYNPSTQTFDASYYFANSGIAKPDFFIINMGINDMFSALTDEAASAKIETCLGLLDDMVESIDQATTTTQICVCVTIPPNHSQDAFGKAYACGQTRDRCKRNNAMWADALIKHFSDSETVSVIPIHTNLDTVYNMGMETMPVNARNTEMTYESPIRNGGVHPSGVGYWQIADVYTAFLKANA